MANDRLDGLLESLSATFDSAVAREEEAAAADLAISLRQGRSLVDVLMRGSWLATLEPGISPRIVAVGRDFAIAAQAGNYLIPLDRLEARRAPDAPQPRHIEVRFVEMLRQVVRSGETVVVSAPSGRHEGLLRWVGLDHLASEGRRGILVVSLAAVRWVSVNSAPDYEPRATPRLPSD